MLQPAYPKRRRPSQLDPNSEMLASSLEPESTKSGVNSLASCATTASSAAISAIDSRAARRFKH